MDAGPDGGVDAGVDLSEPFRAFCRRRIRALCDGNLSCCLDATRRYDTEDCSDAAIEMGCLRASEDPALRDGTLDWDASAAESVLADLESQVADCGAIEQDAAGLDRVLHGTLTSGETCTPDAANGFGSLGLLRCAGSLRCSLTGVATDFSGVCAPLGDLGEGCINPSTDCRSGLWCEFGADGIPPDAPYFGLCQPQGEPCGGDYACPSRFCTRTSRLCAEPEAAETWCRRFL